MWYRHGSLYNGLRTAPRWPEMVPGESKKLGALIEHPSSGTDGREDSSVDRGEVDQNGVGNVYKLDAGPPDEDLYGDDENGLPIPSEFQIGFTDDEAALKVLTDDLYRDDASMKVRAASYIANKPYCSVESSDAVLEESFSFALDDQRVYPNLEPWEELKQRLLDTGEHDMGGFEDFMEMSEELDNSEFTTDFSLDQERRSFKEFLKAKLEEIKS